MTAPPEKSSVLIDIEFLQNSFITYIRSRGDVLGTPFERYMWAFIPQLLDVMKQLERDRSTIRLELLCPADCGAEGCRGQCGGRGLTDDTVVVEKKRSRVEIALPPPDTHQ
jgi:hypothetical protein